ncbi:hypothetical protein [Dialister sp.]|uniref:hypothetical protein n=1 Tax=Dialister sp. TaxID=1955814 RepID=UPI002E808643|nr:hypothetical protein [Dialister sp.]MEE3452690.1 hypothetical protein [Dialister sp.]
MADDKLEKARAERRQKFLDWDIEKELPTEIGEYKLKRLDRQEGRIYFAFCWENEKTGWQVRALFDEETMDYMVKTFFPMVTLTEIELITGEFEEYQRNMKRLTPAYIEKELIHREDVSVLIRGKAFMVWDYTPFFPETIGHYKRTLEPHRPLLGLNGSYIICAYECPEKNTGILFFYNIYREDYYGEFRAQGIPGIIHQYDAKNLEIFEEKITTHLVKDLENLYEHPEIPD